MDEKTYDAAIEAAREIGAEHGANAAGWWEQDAIGGRVTRAGAAEETARRVLAGIDDGDPEILDGLPAPDLSGQWADGYTVTRLVEEIAEELDVDPEIFEDEEDLITSADALADVYCDAFQDAVTDAVATACKALLA